MFARLKAFVPQKLKYRLFTANVFLILLPFSMLNIYNFHRIEWLVQQKISEQSHEQLQNMQRTLEDQMSIAFKTLIFLEQDSTLRSVLQYPQSRSLLENYRLVEERFQNFNNSFFLYNPSVYFTLLDLYGNVYTSYQPRQRLNYETCISHPAFQETLDKKTYLWVPNDENYLFHDISTSPSLLSLYALLKDLNNRPYGLARISIDYTHWFQSTLQNSDSNQDYFIITGHGEQVASSVPDTKLPQSVMSEISRAQRSGYLRDKTTAALVNYSYLESLDWYLVNRIPLDVLFDELNVMKRQYFAMFLAFTLAFIAISFLIAHTFTHPLSYLQAKMKEAVRKDLKVRLPEHKYKGEILALTQTFNRMLDDMNALIHRLKAEERQKDAVRFQMLLAQMNPHFLLNTLNTIKWIALRSRNNDIAEICMSLGKLLEASLNSEVDLIHLKEEMELTLAYIYIQQTRYRDKFEVRIDADASVYYAIVPKLSLQPLIENAIKHGIASMPGKGLIRIRIAAQGRDMLRMEVEDNGIGLEKAKQMAKKRNRPGIGLANLRERLRLLFKDKGQLEIIPLEQGTLARLTIPLLLSPPFEQKENDLTAGGNRHVESASR